MVWLVRRLKRQEIDTQLESKHISTYVLAQAAPPVSNMLPLRYVSAAGGRPLVGDVHLRPHAVAPPWAVEHKGNEQFERNHRHAVDIYSAVVYIFFATLAGGYTGRAFPDGGRSCLAPRWQFPGGGHVCLECATGWRWKPSSAATASCWCGACGPIYANRTPTWSTLQSPCWFRWCGGGVVYIFIVWGSSGAWDLTIR